MTHVRRILHDAALTPAEPFDAEAFVRRAWRPRRRPFIWLGAVVAALAAGLGGQAALTPASDKVAVVRTVERTGQATTATLATDPDADAHRDGDGDAERAPSSSSAGADDRPAGAGSGAQAHRAASAGAGGADASERGAQLPVEPWARQTHEGCSARWSSPEPAPTAPFGSRQVEECTYTATVEAGWWGTGSWTVDIYRNGTTISYDSATGTVCRPVGTIKPGDVVHARLGTREMQQSGVYASAGSEEWRVDVGSWITCRSD